MLAVFTIEVGGAAAARAGMGPGSVCRPTVDSPAVRGPHRLIGQDPAEQVGELVALGGGESGQQFILNLGHDPVEAQQLPAALARRGDDVAALVLRVDSPFV